MKNCHMFKRFFLFSVNIYCLFIHKIKSNTTKLVVEYAIKFINIQKQFLNNHLSVSPQRLY